MAALINMADQMRFVGQFVGHFFRVFYFQRVPGRFGGEGGIRTHGTVTRTTVFEFYDSGAGLYRPVAKRMLWFGISDAVIPVCDAPYHSVLHSWFAIWFANSSPN